MNDVQYRARKAARMNDRDDANVSRGARSKKQIGARTATGTGNLAHFVMASVPEYKGNKNQLKRALNLVNEMIDFSGKNPDKVELRLVLGLSRS